MNNKPSEKETELHGEDVGVLGAIFLRTGHFFSYGVYCYMQKFGFINGVDNVNWPPYRDSKS